MLERFTSYYLERIFYVWLISAVAFKVYKYNNKIIFLRVTYLPSLIYIIKGSKNKQSWRVFISEWKLAHSAYNQNGVINANLYRSILPRRMFIKPCCIMLKYFDPFSQSNIVCIFVIRKSWCGIGTCLLISLLRTDSGFPCSV